MKFAKGRTKLQERKFIKFFSNSFESTWSWSRSGSWNRRHGTVAEIITVARTELERYPAKNGPGSATMTLLKLCLTWST
jgi:hypothetical protein